MEISLIAAVGRHLELGRGGDLIWPISADLKNFKRLTMGHALVMGRKTFASIGRPLPGRLNIVLSQNKELEIPGVMVCQHPSHALAYARDHGQAKCFVIGGAAIYRLFEPLADYLYLTRIDAEAADADVFFPAFDSQVWQRRSIEPHLQTEAHPGFSFENWARIGE